MLIVRTSRPLTVNSLPGVSGLLGLTVADFERQRRVGGHAFSGGAGSAHADLLVRARQRQRKRARPLGERPALSSCRRRSASLRR